MIKAYPTYVGGQWLHLDNTVEVINKFTGEPFATVP